MDALERQQLSTLMKPVAQLERKVEFLMDHLKLDYREPDGVLAVRPQVEALLRQGKVIEAVKLYRLETGLGLKEAKDEVDQIGRAIKGKR
jgi:ribosomal protein L7/L12